MYRTQIMGKLILLLSVLFLHTNIFAQTTQTKNIENRDFEILKNFEIFSGIYKELELNYVDEINPGDMINKALDAMLRSLDPYTVYIPESEVEDYKILTLGKYGGIGSVVGYRNNTVHISEPYENSPAALAGLKPGDRIIAIDGESTEGKKLEDITSRLKGQAGTDIEIKVERDGEVEPLIFKLIRKEITLENIAYSGMLRDSIGYIRLDGFSKNATEDTKKAFLELKRKGMQKLIFDLRYNGGGLMNEAVKIVNLFYKKGVPVVSTKGKVEKKNTVYYTREAVLDSRIPIVFLTSEATASASEIVSGALQDYDRAVVLGERTFGKGLVQNIVPLEYNSQLKLTVSKYYIPSGRCVQAIDYDHSDATGGAKRIPDSLRTEYKTKGGRSVFDGDGIEPDIEVKPTNVADITKSLSRAYLVFDYTNNFIKQNDSIVSIKDFTISDTIYNDFLQFVADRDSLIKLPSELILSELSAYMNKKGTFNTIESDYNILADKLKLKRQSDLLKYREEISLLLKEEIISRYYYRKGRAEVQIEGDNMINSAIYVLNHLKEYYYPILKGKKITSKDLNLK